MRIAPLVECEEDRVEGFALVSEDIGIASAVRADILAPEDSLFKQPVQPLAQHIPGDAGIAHDFAETGCAIEGLADDQPGPVVTKNIEDSRDRAGVRVPLGHVRSPIGERIIWLRFRTITILVAFCNQFAQ